MNNINFNQVGGFPMNSNILGRLQTAYGLLNALGNIAGDKTIISGCVVSGLDTSDGVVFVNGEVFEFKGGTTQTKVIIKEDTEMLLFQNGNSYASIKTRYVQFGTGVSAIDWVDFERGYETKSIAGLVDRIVALEERPLVGNIPIDLIALWGRPANEIPPLWVEYTGLAGRFPVGFKTSDADFDVVGKVGGAKGHTLTVAEMAEHDHDTFVPKDGGGSLDMQSLMISPNADEGLVIAAKTGKTGSGEEFSIMNPYRVVHYIQYKGE